jgi:hypothetical protein
MQVAQEANDSSVVMPIPANGKMINTMEITHGAVTAEMSHGRLVKNLYR